MNKAPVASQPKISVPMRTVKPVRPSERCGVSSALKNGSSAAGGRFVSSMNADYRRTMQKPKTKNEAKNPTAALRRGGKNAKLRPRPARAYSLYTAGEVHEMFRR